MEGLNRDEIFRYICKENSNFVETLKHYLSTIKNNKTYIDDFDDTEKDIKYVGISHFITKNENINLDMRYVESGWIFPYNETAGKCSFYYGYECKMRKQNSARGISLTKQNIEDIKNDINTIIISDKDITIIFDIDELFILFDGILRELALLADIENKTNIITPIMRYKAYTIVILPYMYIVLHMVYIICKMLNIF